MSEKNKKNILVIDDSALMRRILCDIINSDSRYYVNDTASDGVVALKLLETTKYDAMILDINMPKMNGIEFLKELQKRGMTQRVILFSSDTTSGAAVTMEALELGAIDFIPKPVNAIHSAKDEFRNNFLQILSSAVEVPLDRLAENNRGRKSGASIGREETRAAAKVTGNASQPLLKEKEAIRSQEKRMAGQSIKKLVVIASSTGGPKALHRVIPLLPYNLDAAVLVVQHMPTGFTGTLAERLDSVSHLICSEANDQEPIKKGHVYIASGGKHLKYMEKPYQGIYFSDEPPREGVKPCANYLFESLADSSFEEITCVVMTGMGADGTKGIMNLKAYKKLYIIAQDAQSSTVFGMPKSIIETGLVDQIVDLDHIAQEITQKVGVK